MRELAEHILDLLQNSKLAKADKIWLEIFEDLQKDKLTIKITDNGCGMNQQLVNEVLDPFVTTRGKKTGLGIPLFSHTARMSGGNLLVNSRPGEGTIIKTWMQHSNIDRPPLGNIVDTVISSLEHSVDIIFVHKFTNTKGDLTGVVELDTTKIKAELGGVPINNIEVIVWIKNYLKRQYISLIKE